MMNDRLDLHHEIILQLFEGQLHQAPLQNPHRILDVGTGTGIWAIGRYPILRTKRALSGSIMARA